ncbi:hypothetical protein [Streptomyces sp. NBC_00356]|uniref:hypothetical protein n=1 Tax=Streptomyces sp. NBC_00356 TaxID=2975724 RepID=UPI002E263D81
MPDPIPVTPRVDDSAADMSSLVQLGLAEPQPVPEPPPPATDPFQEPDYPGLPGGYVPDETA